MTDVEQERASPAREVAARVLERVWEDGAFAAAALDAELRRAPMAPRDAALATTLVYGVLRTEGYLEERLGAFARQGKLRLRPAERASLLMGAYALCFLDRVPAFAAVSEAASGAKRAGGGASAFVNAILRALARELEEKGRPSMEEAAAASAPGWLRGALRRSLGRKGASAFLAAGEIPPPAGICLAPGESRQAFADELRIARPGAEVREGRASPRALLVRGGGDLRTLEGEGRRFVVQEEGSQVVALALGARPGERVLDACAGRGNKAWTLARLVGPSGEVAAADLFEEKLARLGSRLARAAGGGGVAPVSTFPVDWTKGTAAVPDGFDRVLVDAPCSGIGTMRRRPEIVRLGAEEDPEARLGALSETQGAILVRAASRVRDGGRLVYAVCSVLREESEASVERAREAAGAIGLELEPSPFDAPLPLLEGSASARLLPQEHGTDGFFLASFVVRRR